MSEFRELQESSRRSGYPSWYERVAPDLDEKRRTDLDEALADREISSRVISTVLRSWGHEVSQGQVQRHRSTRGY